MNFKAYMATDGFTVIVEDKEHKTSAKVPLPVYKEKREAWVEEFNKLSADMQAFIWLCIA